jgi:hypothetical protein
VADPARNRAIRVLPGGVVTDVVEADAEVFACVLGGADGRTLFLCVAPGQQSGSSSGAHRVAAAGGAGGRRWTELTYQLRVYLR